MQVLLRELRMAWSTMMWWIIALLLVNLMFLSIFPAFSHDAEASKQLIQGFPPQIRAMLGLSIESFLTFLGFYAYTFTYVGLAGGVQAMNLGLMMLGRESASGTTDFLLTRPVARTTIFIQKYIAGIVVLLITNVVLAGGTFLLAKAFGAGDFSIKVFGLLTVSLLIIQGVFLSIGSVVSQLVGRVRSVVSVSLSVVCGFFAVHLVQSITHDEMLRYLTPFGFFNHMRTVVEKSYEAQFVWVAMTLFVLCIITAYTLYVKRDVRSNS